MRVPEIKMMMEKALLVSHRTAIDHNHFHYHHYYHWLYDCAEQRLVSLVLTNSLISTVV